MNKSRHTILCVPDVFSKEKRSEIMGKIRSKNTGLEKRARKILRKNGIRFRSHPKLYGNPDFLLENKIILFCDSSFWHGKNWFKLKKRLEAGNNPEYWVSHISKNRARDRQVTKELARQGYKVLRLWDEEIYKNSEASVAKIKKML